MLRGICAFFLALVLVSPRAFAASYDLKEMTPAVKQAIENRKVRYAELEALKRQGSIGEDNQGLVKVLKDLPSSGPVALAENYDREVIYQAIVEQNGLGPEGPDQVHAVFAEVQRGKAQTGDFIQLRTGEWVQK